MMRKTTYYKIQVLTALEDSLWHDWHDAPKFPFRIDAFDEATRLEVYYNFIKDTRIIRVTTTHTVVDDD